jgi:hypothetical protein
MVLISTSSVFVTLAISCGTLAVSLIDALEANGATRFSQALLADPTLLAFYNSPSVKTIFAPIDSSTGNFTLVIRDPDPVDATYQTLGAKNSMDSMEQCPGEDLETNKSTQQKDGKSQDIVTQTNCTGSSKIRRNFGYGSQFESHSGFSSGWLSNGHLGMEPETSCAETYGSVQWGLSAWTPSSIQSSPFWPLQSESGPSSVLSYSLASSPTASISLPGISTSCISTPNIPTSFSSPPPISTQRTKTTSTSIPVIPTNTPLSTPLSLSSTPVLSPTVPEINVTPSASGDLPSTTPDTGRLPDQPVNIASGLGNTVDLLRGDIPYDGGIIHIVSG